MFKRLWRDLQRAMHRARCPKVHWYGYPTYMADKDGHWLG